MRHFAILSILILFSTSLTGQISQGGEPYQWNDKNVSPGYNVHLTPALDMAAIIAEDLVVDQYKETPYRFGIDVEVDIDFLAQSTFQLTEDGQRIYRLEIKCLNATSINFIFGDYQIPEGGALYVYDKAKTEFLGSFTDANNKEYESLAIGLIHSDEIIIEYHEPTDVVGETSLIISQITHGYRPVLNKFDPTRGPFGTSGGCNMNVNCPDGDPWQDEKRGIGLILEGGFAICTGSLINNTNNDGTPYFLTAAHCDGNESNWLIFFNHEYSNCSNTGSIPTNQSISGGTQVASTIPSDAHLIELSQNVPDSYAPYYNGWNRSGGFVSKGVSIHHPSGDAKKISFDDDPLQKTFSGSSITSPNGNYWRIESWERNTTTEGGSSGAPLFDQNHRIIGQLQGGGAACGNSASDWYGAMHSSYAALSAFLAPGNPNTLFIDGYDPLAPIGPITLNLKVFLQGPYNPAFLNMSSQLNQMEVIPLTEPYTALSFDHIQGGGETMDASVLDINGSNAIVDWIFIELRSGENANEAIATQSALVQRDGDIVATDGVSAITFTGIEEATVYVAIRHRNHFGIRSGLSYSTASPISIDFRSPQTAVYGDNAMITVNNKMVMIAGDSNNDGQINSIDRNDAWRIQNGTPYNYLNSSADYDLNGTVNPIDNNEFWRLNNSMSEQLD